MEATLEKKIDVVVAGHVCLDITPVFMRDNKLDLQRIFAPGNLTNMSGIEVAAAGAVPNVGISLHRLGIKTRLMGKTGKDFFGRGILDFLREKNIEGKMVEAEGGNTSYTIVISPPGTDRIFFHDPGTNDTFTSADIDYEIVKQAKLFHFGYPPLMKKMYENGGQELIKIFKKVKKLGVLTSLDMAYTEPSSESGKADWTEILKKVLPYTDIYMPSVEETLFMLKRDYFNEITNAGDNLVEKLDVNVLPELGERLLSFGARIVVIKCGVKGYYVRTRQSQYFTGISKLTKINIDNWAGRELLVETYNVKGIKSTTGAGDSSIAGFLAAFLKGYSIEETVKIAHAVATQSITSYDVFSNIKNFETILEMIKRDKPVISLDIEGNYWKYSHDLCLWKGNRTKNPINSWDEY